VIGVSTRQARGLSQTSAVTPSLRRRQLATALAAFPLNRLCPTDLREVRLWSGRFEQLDAVLKDLNQEEQGDDRDQ
jgi:hypothetical protein